MISYTHTKKHNVLTFPRKQFIVTVVGTGVSMECILEFHTLQLIQAAQGHPGLHQLAKLQEGKLCIPLKHLPQLRALPAPVPPSQLFWYSRTMKDNQRLETYLQQLVQQSLVAPDYSWMGLAWESCGQELIPGQGHLEVGYPLTLEELKVASGSCRYGLSTVKGCPC